jgi:hypothetical protein
MRDAYRTAIAAETNGLGLRATDCDWYTTGDAKHESLGDDYRAPRPLRKPHDDQLAIRTRVGCTLVVFGEHLHAIACVRRTIRSPLVATVCRTTRPVQRQKPHHGADRQRACWHEPENPEHYMTAFITNAADCDPNRWSGDRRHSARRRQVHWPYARTLYRFDDGAAFAYRCGRDFFRSSDNTLRAHDSDGLLLSARSCTPLLRRIATSTSTSRTIGRSTTNALP